MLSWNSATKWKSDSWTYQSESSEMDPGTTGRRLTPARLQILEDFANHDREVIETGEHQPPVDEIEFRVKNPLFLCIFPLKLAVGRSSIGRLDQAQVGPYYIRVWMLPGEANRPYARSSSNIEYVGRIANWCGIQLIAK